MNMYSQHSSFRSSSPENHEPSITNTYDLSFHPVHLQNSFISQQRYSQRMGSLYKRNHPSTPLFYKLSKSVSPQNVINHNGVCVGNDNELPIAAVFPGDSSSFIAAFPDAQEIHPNGPVRGIPIRCGSIWKKVERLDEVMEISKPRDISDADWCRYVHLFCIYCGKRYTSLWSLENDCGGHDHSKEDGRWKEIDISNIERAKKGFDQMKCVDEIMNSVIEDNTFEPTEKITDQRKKEGVVDFNQFLNNDPDILTKTFECKLCHQQFIGQDRLNHFMKDHHEIYDDIVGVFWKRNLNEKEDWHSSFYQDRRDRRRSPRRGFENRVERRFEGNEGLLDDIKAPPASYLSFLEKLN
ncbi:hypothetical protein EDI_136740 [Entamoeba dispar SAW760]|uniref:C2H2-type domain-containing protein n=1 Tax=Entamoeba dispar (strain ATCC PRA-260 / SAW760) TaxID=370354 RepID=B0EK90_ENTDS|nr:uncharacterized protein EDI_136740 [Entamoeba dispar SAW760]EDR25054.1 hypothetical protein EDI_136740 [Entamoeba dispar SAW760]|eukprot:EDR25054.1 hypothetical protein EDI_136740 [Entamoeba dispar SAW760]